MLLFNPRVTLFTKLLINIVVYVLHTRCYPSDDVLHSSFWLLHTGFFTSIVINFYQITPSRSPTIVSSNIFKVVQWRMLRLNWMLPLNTFQTDIACSTAKSFFLMVLLIGVQWGCWLQISNIDIVDWSKLTLKGTCIIVSYLTKSQSWLSFLTLFVSDLNIFCFCLPLSE